ncbi:hypothetical protein EVAR_24130_1 [Eumeta japonica]|uniref:Uncharacterized protein n=1 Tax=Eumeta variegata TaxID=151549 RepID=A0A4C1YQZ8_EUMVA|nr:hypothetical protein EVAR_24130_1 [Eumeta japonica]
MFYLPVPSPAPARPPSRSEPRCTLDLVVPQEYPGRCKHGVRHPGLTKLVLEKTLVGDSSELYLTPNTTLEPPDVVPRHDLHSPMSDEYRTPDTTICDDNASFSMPSYFDRKKRTAADIISAAVKPLTNFQIFKQKSLNTIPALGEPRRRHDELFNNFPFLTPLAHRKGSVVPDDAPEPRLAGRLEAEFYCISSDRDSERGSDERLDLHHRFKSLSNRALNDHAHLDDPLTSTPALPAPATALRPTQRVYQKHDPPLQRNHYVQERAYRYTAGGALAALRHSYTGHASTYSLTTSACVVRRTTNGSVGGRRRDAGAGVGEWCACGAPLPQCEGGPLSLPRRPSSALNPSSGSLTASASESGSLDRGKAALERRKQRPGPPPAPHPQDEPAAAAWCRVENTRVNPDSLIDELLAATDLKHAVEDSAETSGLQLFIARDGTAELGTRQARQQLARRDLQRVVVQPHPHDNRSAVIDE